MTREEVLSVSPDLSKEQLDKILKMYGEGIVREKSRTTELEKKYNDLQTMYNSSLSTVSDLEKIAKETEDLKKRISDYEKAEEERKQLLAKQEKENNLLKRFNEVSKDKIFINEITQKGIYEEFKKQLDVEDNKSISDSDLFNNITKDKNDIFKNPNKPVDIHGVNPKNVEETIVKKSFPKFF